jgi:hypothetical protein
VKGSAGAPVVLQATEGIELSGDDHEAEFASRRGSHERLLPRSNRVDQGTHLQSAHFPRPSLAAS